MRYLPLTEDDRAQMREAIGVPTAEALYADVPKDVLLTRPLDLPRGRGEMEVERHLAALARNNVAASRSFLGAGAYRHHIPASVDHLIQRSEFLTSYTPYQPEISQGTLQVLFEFQTQVAALTGMEIANASMYDGSTACAEAALMAHRVTKRRKAVLSGGLHPHYAEVVRTLSRFAGDEVDTLAPDVFAREDITAQIDDDVSCVIVQTPDVFGNLRDLSPIARACHAKGALLVAVVTEAVSLGLVTPPGDFGADIVVGEGQSLGNPLSFGGPYVGLFATKQEHLRQMPGRLCGETVDADGRRSFVLTLSAREQHIRRDKATSNICTNSGLCALAFSIHLTLLGEAGLRRLARANHASAVRLAERLARVHGVEVLNETFFNEFTLRVSSDAARLVERLAERGVLAGVPVSRLLPGAGLDDLLLVTSTEVATNEDHEAFIAALEGAL
ncbi:MULTISPECIES: aminomethyl-transferring glycine dehydrogenase subunit GcvPA [Methylosinus]|uniref:Probable glycine dehydrogenase (decarboxylating) subunit 1 n=1 Tax=Methylosinus trichosporium (strain ATCC 35070 / NCIMB 11131 / UNIQEM 75 / OB3b) TaxID=595536 RepID=A0A2D2D1B4_METT3|nr:MULTISPECIES: aminomethyl-transferring glycine dehydrogenase subunit GcvPA [Methylosinus]ATQ68754.1 aminomethyl-transferring glycine dehydrogenase [Methylosinus trichosporium OB3b]OBS53085.1 glycine dehydrogenase (aminomethyl-transferring) [Methylosinus sp. 3S-1]